MKLIHLSDLHLGKKVNEFSMIEDQKYILTKIINIIDEEKPDGVIIAGDIYDKSVPSTEAVALLDDFLVKLSKRNLQVFIISGNHDSPERLAFANRLLGTKGVHISSAYDGKVEAVELEDEYGKLYIYLLPFIKPAHVKRHFPDAEIVTYTDAISYAIENMNVDKSKRNILVTHQFVTGAERSDSEEISVGGLDNVDAIAFKGFDYVALGHIHAPQNVGKDYIRYCGTPLKYSFSESKHMKSVTVINMEEKGLVDVSTRPLEPVRDMVEIKGMYEDLTLRDFYKDTTYQEDYVHITLTDEEDIPDAISKLRTIYHNLMRLDYDNQRTRNSSMLTKIQEMEKYSPLELFEDFYEKQNGKGMSEEQKALVKNHIEKIWENEL
ncbi:MAG: exonuclease SbcCD subunit D [Clostridiales bacterium]|nr:exonuclease SbcCD subunit D [Clostridiales bacterium]